MYTLCTLLKWIYDKVVYALASIAGIGVVLVFAGVIYDVSLRTSGLQPPVWVSALSEYAMLVITMGAAPLLVRWRGHVWMEVVASVASPNILAALAKLVYVLCAAVCLVLSYVASVMALEMAARGIVDIRSIVLPGWLLYAFLATGFFFCATEFLRFLLGSADMYAGDGEMEGL